MKVFGQLESAQAENLSGNPTPTPHGRYFWDTTLFLLKIYDSLNWVKIPGRHVQGSRASPSAITAVGGLTPVVAGCDQVWFLQGSGGAVTVTANPQIAAGTFVGQKLLLKGRSDTNTVSFANGTGLSLNGDCLLGDDSTLGLTWDGTNWSEDFRR